MAIKPTNQPTAVPAMLTPETLIAEGAAIQAAAVRRNTEPLISDQFMATVSAGLDMHTNEKIYEVVRVPGCIIAGGDPDFAAMYAAGRDCYLDEVYKGEQKVCDITSDGFIAMVREEVEHYQRDDEPTDIELAGFLFGYVTACVEEFHGLNCLECGRSRGLCVHSH